MLDVGKRNKMINYRKTKRATLELTSPGYREIFTRLTVKDETLTFQTKIDCSRNLQITQLFYLMDRLGCPVAFTQGEIETDMSVEESNRTLKALRAKARLSLDEQSINILYLSFGFLEWRQKFSDNPILSPLILVPVTLTLDSVADPYRMKRLDEDIVVNPTLEYVLNSDYGVRLPDFDAGKDDLDEFFAEVQEMVRPSGWIVKRAANLGLLSFLKIVMYKDLERYREKIFQNPIVEAFCGDPSGLPKIEDGWRGYDHDKTAAVDSFQVVNADSSQQDAILLSKKDVSFVLQGPPGTGKSQTITNIIAEGLADGKKILFVSEKMAALNVVYRRLQEVNLAEYCLSLHNYKADKKEVISDLAESLDAPRKTLKNGVMDFLGELDQEKLDLDGYFEEIHKVREAAGAINLQCAYRACHTGIGTDVAA